MSFDLGLQGYDEARGQQFYKQLQERLQSLPGVESAAVMSYIPLSINYNSNTITAVNPTSVLRAEGIDAFLSRRERLFIEGAAPKSKAILSTNYSVGSWDAALRLRISVRSLSARSPAHPYRINSIGRARRSI